MKKAVAVLLPYLEAEKERAAAAGESGEASNKGRILMATVKGDVHDIGKNIVGVVLQCNNYEVVDLGVMVSTDRILEAALEHKVDIIGLSGLITPSLDEMVGVAREMERRGLQLPLLIGGATTSKAHTAVKIAPVYSGTVVHVLDASRSVPVVSTLLSPEQRSEFAVRNKQEQTTMRDGYLNRAAAKNMLSLEQARSKRWTTDWQTYRSVQPAQLGIHDEQQWSLSELVDYIDWTPFFQAWELHGRFPDLLKDEVVGEAATKLFEDAQRMLSELVDGNKLTAKAVWGLFPAYSTPDDRLVMDGQWEFPLLRQQAAKAGDLPNFCLSDFVAPQSSGTPDWAGAFAVGIFGAEDLALAYQKDYDDFSAIMVKALADRLAEALAEALHAKVRQEDWGYAPIEQLSNADLIAEKYTGIRPAPGYPACPDHLDKPTLWAMLEVEQRLGMQLTESLAMTPAAAVSGFYLGHPEARYFGVGKIGQDQLEDHAKRRKIPLEEARRWLAPVLLDA
jgi:5-methyltetrahydrofolate--homocysteine methyltransferase